MNTITLNKNNPIGEYTLKLMINTPLNNGSKEGLYLNQAPYIAIEKSLFSEWGSPNPNIAKSILIK